ncbi:MAG: hypothetical protein OEL20_11740 [Sulfuritalea sp.]|nr:hypothetical protein [Sulfuritalea sp.]
MRAVIIAAISALPLIGAAQTIDRVKLTDSELTCPQIYGEIDEMNKVMGLAKGDRDASATTAAGAGLTQQATGVAVQAAALSGSVGAAVGLAQAAPLLGLFGSATKSVADAKEKEAAERLGEAKARKEHLTGLFVSRNCKLSDVKQEAAATTPKLN